jgi:hypothetical protein
MDVLTWYSSKIPKAEQWSGQQKALQLHDANAYENHVRGLARCDIEHKQTTQQHTSESPRNLVTLARSYAGSTEESWVHLKQLKLLLSFRRLMFFSICLVLSEHGSSESVLEALMWWTRRDEKKRISILKGTKWVHQTIVSLVERGWSISRATELFFLGKTLIYAYLYLQNLTCGSVPLSNERLIQLASKPTSDFVEKIEDPDNISRKPFLTPNFTFPTLIKELCKDCRPPLLYVYVK